MGYMGFGMQKPKNIRKPRKGFVNLKKLQSVERSNLKKQTNSHPLKFKSNKGLNDSQKQDASSFNYTRMLKIATFVALVAVVINYVIIQPANKTQDKIAAGYDQEVAKLFELGSHYSNTHEFELNSQGLVKLAISDDLSTNKQYYRNQEWFRVNMETNPKANFEFTGDDLLIKEHSDWVNVEEKWTLYYTSDICHQNFGKISDYLGSDIVSASVMVDLMKKRGFERIKTDRGVLSISLTGSENQAGYKFIRAESVPYEAEMIKEIDSITYLVYY